MSMETYTASDAKRLFGNVLNECVYGKRAVSVKKHGKVVAFIVPAEMWQGQGGEVKAKPLEMMTKLRKIWAAHKKNKKPKIDTVTFIKQLRAERTNRILKATKGS